LTRPSLKRNIVSDGCDVHTGHSVRASVDMLSTLWGPRQCEIPHTSVQINCTQMLLTIIAHYCGQMFTLMCAIIPRSCDQIFALHASLACIRRRADSGSHFMTNESHVTLQSVDP